MGRLKTMTTPFEVTVREPLPFEMPAVTHMFMESWLYLVVNVLGKSVDDVSHPPVLDKPILVALDKNDSLVGLLQTSGHSLDRLYVSPRVLGSGIGSLLLHRAEGLGVNTLCVDEGNLPARTFYERHGWTWNKEVNHGSVVPTWQTLTYTKVV